MWSHTPRAKETESEQNKRRKKKGKRERGIIRDGRRVPMVFMVKANTHSCHDMYVYQTRHELSVVYILILSFPSAS